MNMNRPDMTEDVKSSVRSILLHANFLSEISSDF